VFENLWRIKMVCEKTGVLPENERNFALAPVLGQLRRKKAPKSDKKKFQQFSEMTGVISQNRSVPVELLAVLLGVMLTTPSSVKTEELVICDLSSKSKESTLLHFELCLQTEFSDEFLSFNPAFLEITFSPETKNAEFSAEFVFDSPESTPELCPFEPLDL